MNFLQLADALLASVPCVQPDERERLTRWADLLASHGRATLPFLLISNSPTNFKVSLIYPDGVKQNTQFRLIPRLWTAGDSR